MNNAMELSRRLLKGRSFQVGVDATLGLGKDAFFLSQCCKKVYAFEIQKEAVFQAEKFLKNKSVKNVTVFFRSHATIKELMKEPVDLFLYNLGYLPGGDKSFTTELSTTIESVEQAMKLLSPQGEIHIVSYPGHEEGRREDIGLETFCSKLDQKQWNVFMTNHLNGKNQPPKLYVICKKK